MYTKLVMFSVKNFLTFFILCFFAFLIFTALFFKKNNNDSIISWKNYIKKTELNGFLYLVHDTVENKNFYITTETQPTQDDINDIRYKITFMGTSDIWNPRACAKMPSVITDNGDIYMIDYSYNGSEKIKYLLWFTMDTKKIKYFNMVNFSIPSQIYKYKDIVYFFTQKNNKILRNIITKENSLETLPLTEVREGEIFLFYYRFSSSLLYIKKTTNTLEKEKYFTYDYVKNSLNHASNIPYEISIEGLKQKKMLSNGTEMYWNLANPFDVGFISENKFVPIFKDNSRIYTYILGGF